MTDTMIVGRKAFIAWLERAIAEARAAGRINYDIRQGSVLRTVEYAESTGTVCLTLQMYCNTLERTLRRVRQSPMQRARHPAKLRKVPINE